MEAQKKTLKKNYKIKKLKYTTLWLVFFFKYFFLFGLVTKMITKFECGKVRIENINVQYVFVITTFRCRIKSS